MSDNISNINSNFIYILTIYFKIKRCNCDVDDTGTVNIALTYEKF